MDFRGNEDFFGFTERDVIDLFLNKNLTMRGVAKELNTNHKLISRILKRNDIEINGRTYPKREVSLEQRKKTSEFHKGKTWNKGVKQSKVHMIKNMLAKLNRKLVTYEILEKYDDFEKLKFLNRVISRNRKHFDDIRYLNYLQKFWNDTQFNNVYNNWIINKTKWMYPSLDHIIPISKGGGFELTNLRFITWFENKTKTNMMPDEWENIKKNIYNY